MIYVVSRVFQLSIFGFFILIVGKGWSVLYWLIFLFYHHILNACFFYVKSVYSINWLISALRRIGRISTVLCNIAIFEILFKSSQCVIQMKISMTVLWEINVYFWWKFHFKMDSFKFPIRMKWILGKCRDWERFCLTFNLFTLTLRFFTECGVRTFSQDCKDSCGVCIANDQCHHINGSCHGGCDRGYQGIMCAEGCTSPLTVNFTH